MVDDIRDAPIVPMVRHHPDVAFKDHNVPALPLIDVVDVGGEGDGGMGKVDLQISHPAEIDVLIRGLDVVVFRMGMNILVYQQLKVISGVAQTVGHHVGADPVSVVGIAGSVVLALIFGLGGDVLPNPLEDVGLVIDPVPVPVHRTDLICNAEIGVGFGGDGGKAGAQKVVAEVKQSSP